MNKEIAISLSKIPSQIRVEFMAKLQKCANAEDMKALAEDYKLSFNEQTISKVEAYLNSNQVLSDEDLAAVAGGSAFIDGTSVTNTCSC